MVFAAEKLKTLQLEYRVNSQSEDLLILLEEIKANPQCIFDINVASANDALLILINLMCCEESVDYSTFTTLKSIVLDFFIESVTYPEVAWFINENIGLVSILFDEILKHNENQIYSKVLRCLNLYLKFEKNESLAFDVCDGSCCDYYTKKKLSLPKISSACCVIVKMCLKEINNGSIYGTDLALILLNTIYQQFNIQPSPETCGNSSIYNTFRHFLLSVFESTKYSSLCVVNALSCLLRCRDLDSDKCFNETNGKYTLGVVYDILINWDSVDELSPPLYAISLLTAMMQQSHFVDLIRRAWSVDYFKNICRKFIGEYPVAFYETILSFFLTVKDKIPEWNACLHRFLHTNSKLFTFVNKLTLHESHRCSILAWRLMKTYFKPSEISELFIHEYLTMVSNSVKWNLEKSFICDKYHDVPKSMIGRFHVRSVKRALESCSFFLLLLDNGALSDQLVNICIGSKMLPFLVALCNDLMDTGSNLFVGLQPYSAELLGPLLCEGKQWFVSGARLVVSLMFVHVSMSQNYPDLVCIKAFEPILTSDSFAKMLAICFSQSTDNGLIERCIALVSYCSRMSNYNISLLSRLMQVNHKYFSTSGRVIVDREHFAVDRDLANHMSTCTLVTDSAHSTKHRETISAIVDSWLAGDKREFSGSEVVLVFEDYIKSMGEHERFLEAALVEKDGYIKHCNESVDQLRVRARGDEVLMQRLTSSVRVLTEAVETKEVTVSRLSDVTKQYEERLARVEGEMSKQAQELVALAAKLKDTEEKYSRATDDLAVSEESNNELRTLLTTADAENRGKDLEIKRLTDITETIESLFHRR